MSQPLRTLGYGNRQMDDVLALARMHQTRYPIDVRSVLRRTLSASSRR